MHPILQGMRDGLSMWAQSKSLAREELQLQRYAVEADTSLMRSLRKEAEGWSDPNKSTKTLENMDRDQARKSTRQAMHKRGLVSGTVRQLVKYSVGLGARFSPLSTNEVYNDWMQNYLQYNLTRHRQKEIIRRYWRDGEMILRVFQDFDAGTIPLRFIDPEQIFDPENPTNQGIITEPGDIVSHLAYVRSHGGQRLEVIPAADVIFVTAQVDENELRGITPLYPGLYWAENYDQLLRARVTLNKARTAVVAIHKVAGRAGALTRTATAAPVTRSTPADIGTNQHRSRMAPSGTKITIGKDDDYSFESPNIQGRDASSDLRAVRLQYASAIGMPEYLVTADTSNGNYASILVAQDPAVKEIEEQQAMQREIFQDVINRVTVAAVEMSMIPQPETSEYEISWPPIVNVDRKEQTERNVILVREQIMSKRTAAHREDLDFEDEQDQISAEKMAVDPDLNLSKLRDAPTG